MVFFALLFHGFTNNIIFIYLKLGLKNINILDGRHTNEQQTII